MRSPPLHIVSTLAAVVLILLVADGRADETDAAADGHAHLRLWSDTPSEIAPDFELQAVPSDADIAPTTDVIDRTPSPDGAYLAWRRYVPGDPRPERLYVGRVVERERVDQSGDDIPNASVENIREVRGLPLVHRPFSDLDWTDGTTLAVDRRSQPHYGWHYEIDVAAGELVRAAAFPDAFYLEQIGGAITD